MLRVRVKPLRNEGRFTAIEYGILAGLTVIAVERLATTFWITHRAVGLSTPRLHAFFQQPRLRDARATGPRHAAWLL